MPIQSKLDNEIEWDTSFIRKKKKEIKKVTLKRKFNS